jgi:uncharacterized protein (TIGR03435 family)
MRGFIVSASCLILGCSAAFSQDGNPRFEVASVRPASPQGPNILRMPGGPGTADPERFAYSHVVLKGFLLRAYGLKYYQLSGPDWLDSAMFDINAKVPPGATKEQVDIMLRNLLEERFNLTLHHESKEMSVYELSVGKNGPRLKEADLTPPPVREPGSPPRTIGVPDKEGFPQVPPGFGATVGRMTDGIMRWTGKAQSLSDLASVLGGELERPVVDKTGLNGKFDFSLAYSRDGLRQRQPPPGAVATPVDDTPSGGPTLFKAVEEQLGRKLESTKDPIDILVIDHIDKVPTDN